MAHATDQDDKFEGEYIAARLRGDIDHVARLLSERLRQMDKRAREANRRADAAEAENERLRSALTPSAETKALLIGEFWEDIDVPNPDYDEDDEDSDEGEWVAQRVPVQWTTIKAIMEKLRRAALSEAQP